MLTKDKTKDLIGKTLKKYDQDIVAPKIKSALQEHSEILATSSMNGHMSKEDKAKLDGIEAGATRYVHPTGDGNLHVPATGTNNDGKVLKAGATAGSLQWSDINWSDVKGKPSSFTPSAHTHEMSEVNGLEAVLETKETVENVTAKVAAGVQEAKAHAESKATAALQEAKAHTTAQVEEALEEAKAHAEAKSTEALGQSKAYTDTKTAQTLADAKTYANEKVAELVGSAPETLDTLEELAGALKNNADVVDVLQSSIASKADKDHKHVIADVTGLEEALEQAANKEHTHTPDEIITDEEHRFVTDAQIQQWEENTVYSNDMAMVSALGGLPAGQTFDNMPINELLTKLLYPYIKPTISLTGTPNGGSYEKGAQVSTVNLVANVGKKSEKIKEVKFYDGNTVINTAAVKENGGQHTFAMTTPFGTNKTFKATVSDGKNTVTSGTISFNFYYPAYMGALDAGVAVPTSEQIKGLAVKKVQSAGNLSYGYTVTEKRMTIATPPGWNIKKILDPNSFDVTSSFKKHTVQVECLDGTTQPYNVYVSEPTTQTNFTMKYNVN